MPYISETPLLDMVGCFEDRADRAMTGWWFDSPTMTARTCIAVCKAKVSTKAQSYRFD